VTSGVRALALARPSESHALVEAMGAVKACVRPEDEPPDPMRLAPVEHDLHEGLADSAAAEGGVEVEAVELCSAVGEPVDPDGAHDHAVETADPERASGAAIVAVEVEEVRDLGGRLPQKVVLGEDPADERDDRGRVGRTRALDHDRVSAHDAHPRVHRVRESSRR
jgi:hypothetical protein